MRQDTQAAFRNFKRTALNQDPRNVDPRTRESLERQLDQIPQAFTLGEPLRKQAQSEHFAPNIGIYFKLVPRGRCCRCTVRPGPRSPARVPPSSGSSRETRSISSDSLPIRMAVDVMNHHARTDVAFINVRTNRSASAA